MKVIVLNAAGRFTRLQGKVSFLTADAAALKETVGGLASEGQPFVLLWHEDPQAALVLLRDLRREGRLPAGLRGCVLFRALRYAGLDTAKKARERVRRAQFEETVHILSSIVAESGPSEDVAGRFERFVAAVAEMDEGDGPLPFGILEPPDEESKRKLADAVLYLARKSVSSSLLREDEAREAVRWDMTLRDVRLEGGNGPLAPVESVLDYKRFCPACPKRGQLEHSDLRDQVIMPGGAAAETCDSDEKAEIVEKINSAASELANRLENMLRAENAGAFLREVMGLMAPYLHPESERFSSAAARLLREEFQERCDLYRQRRELEEGIASLRRASTTTPHGDEDRRRSKGERLRELVNAARQLRNNLQCDDVKRKVEVTQ
jgi:hypothetical protein